MVPVRVGISLRINNKSFKGSSLVQAWHSERASKREGERERGKRKRKEMKDTREQEEQRKQGTHSGTHVKGDVDDEQYMDKETGDQQESRVTYKISNQESRPGRSAGVQGRLRANTMTIKDEEGRRMCSPSKPVAHKLCLQSFFTVFVLNNMTFHI